MTKKEKIKIYYYEKKLNTIEISKKLKVTKQYVSKIIRMDNRYDNEKLKRKQESAIRQKKRNIKCITKKRKINQLKKAQANAILEKQHIQASIELSGRKTINNRAFKKWNSSIYEYHNRTREYRLKEEIKSKVSYAIPKKIKWD